MPDRRNDETILSFTTGGVRLKDAGHFNQLILQLLKIYWHKEYRISPIPKNHLGLKHVHHHLVQKGILGDFYIKPF